MIGYELLVGCTCLLVDVTDEYPLRRELYHHFGFGMMWDDFLCDLGRRIREKRLHQYMFLTDIRKNHDFVTYLQNYYKYVVYDCKQNIEDIHILKALELAGVKITRGNHLKKKWGCLFGYQSHGRLQQGENVLGQALWFYRNEMDWREISKTYGDRALNYYMGKGIKLYDVEKKSFESVEFYNSISNDWIPVLPKLRDEPEGDTQRFQDCCSSQVTYENGLRKTLYQPPYYYGTVYCIGLCTMYGVYVKDEDTIPSYIQNEINKRMIPYRVVNLGYYVECSLDLKRFKIEEQDIIVVLHIDIYPEMEKGLNCIDISARMEKFHTEIFFGNMYAHVNTAGSRAYAQSMMPEILKAVRLADTAKLKKNNPFDLNKPIPFAYPQRQIMEKTLREMALWSSSWKKTEKIGAIVMNANPFTRGHLYLVEQAFLRVTYLYLFVVEENKSAFTFTERFDMVMRGVEAFKDKVAVVPSGMVASELFFPDYFNPAKNNIVSSISTVTDHVLFSKYYAKYGNIKYRFVGTEDGDNTTAQYNRDMKYVLPYFGIEVVEIDRARDERGQEFRAGIVRTAMKEGKLDQAKWVIPKTTYLYLKEKHLDEKWYSSKKNEDDARA